MSTEARETIHVSNCPCCGAMAQCIATDDPDGVPGKRRRRVRMSVDAEAFQDDIADILRALGLGDHARPISPHQVVHHEIIPAIRALDGPGEGEATDARGDRRYSGSTTDDASRVTRRADAWAVCFNCRHSQRICTAHKIERETCNNCGSHDVLVLYDAAPTDTPGEFHDVDLGPEDGWETGNEDAIGDHTGPPDPDPASGDEGEGTYEETLARSSKGKVEAFLQGGGNQQLLWSAVASLETLLREIRSRPEPTVEGEKDPPDHVLAGWLEGAARALEQFTKAPEAAAHVREAARRLRGENDVP